MAIITNNYKYTYLYFLINILIFDTMGIPSYFSHIIRSHPAIRKMKLPITGIDEFYMDSNSVVYDAFNHLEGNNAGNTIITNDMIINHVIESLDKLINKVPIKALLYIAFDGTAPVAKIAQQRDRRFKSAAISLILPNTLQITPGTKFMDDLTIAVKAHFLYGEPRPYKIIISGSDEPGEGEQKMFSYVRENYTQSKADNMSTMSAAVYGLDADLFMLSLFHCKYWKELYIYRERQVESKSSSSSSSKSNSPIDAVDVLDICELEHRLCQYSNGDIRQYIFMCFLLGNDFIKKMIILDLRGNGMQLLMNIYKHISKPFIVGKDDNIHWKNVWTFLDVLAKKEQSLLCTLYQEREKQEIRVNGMNETDKQRMYPCINREIEKYICPTEDGWQYRYYQVLLDIDITTNHGKDELKKICINYLESLEWTWKYYSKDCPDWKWKYNYAYAPLISDLVKYIPHYTMNFFPPELITIPISSQLQLALVYPRNDAQKWIVSKSGCDFIDKYGKQLYGNNDGGDDDDDCCTKLEYHSAFCTFDWECHPILPPINELLLLLHVETNVK